MPTIRSWIRFSITDQFVCTAVFFSNVFNREGSSESRSEFVGDFRAYRYVVIVGVTAARPARPPFLRDRASSRTSATTHSSLDRLSARRANYRPGRNIPPSTERRRTAQRDEVSNPRLFPLSGSPLFPHMPCVESTNHIRTSPSRLMMCTAARPSHPDRAAELRSCAPHASRMPLRFCRPPRPAASAGRLRHSEPPSAWRSARRLLPGAQNGAFCMALSTAPSAWRSARRLLPGSSSALSLALGTALSNRGGSGEDPARVP